MFDECKFTEDKLIASKTVSLSHILSTYDGKCDDLELSLDLVQGPNASVFVKKPSKVNAGELITTIRGFSMEMAEIVNPELANRGTFIDFEYPIINNFMQN